MATLGEAVLKTGVDTSGLRAGLDDARGQTEGWIGSVGSIIQTGLGVAAGLGIVSAISGAFDTLHDAIVGGIRGVMEEEEAFVRLESIIRATGGAAGLTAPEMHNMARELALVTRFTEESIMAGQGIMLTFDQIGAETMPRATRAMLDLSSVFGQDLPSAARLIGRALQNPAEGLGGLSRLGIQFTDAQEKMIEKMVKSGKIAEAQAFILSELESRVGGVAEAMGETAAGQFERFSNQMDEAKEQVMEPFLPILSQIGDRLLEALASPQVQAGLAALADMIGNFADSAMRLFNIFKLGGFSAVLDEVFGPRIGGMITRIIEQMSRLGEDVGPDVAVLFQDIKRFLSDLVTAIGPEVIDNLFGAISGGIALISEFWQEHGDTVIGIANFLARVAAVTLGGTVSMIAALAQAFIQLLQGDPQAALDTIVQSLLGFVESALSIVGVSLPDFVKQWKSNFEMLGIIATAVFEGIRGTIEGAIDAIRRAIQGLINRMGELRRQLLDLVIPDWLQRRSPPPLALAFADVDRSLTRLVTGSLRDFATNMQALQPQQNISTGMLLVQGNQFGGQVDFRESLVEALRSW